MDTFAFIYSKILAIFTLIGILGIIFLIIGFIIPLGRRQFLPFIQKYAIKIAFILSASATLGSLFFSEIIGFIPCQLCWYQRVFMYPIALILAIDVIKKDSKITDYVLSLSIGGAIIALSHYYIQMSGTPTFLCPTTDPSLSCVQRLIFEFNFITIPFMSLTIFILVGLLMIAQKVYNPVKLK